MNRITEWLWMFMCYEIVLLCFTDTEAKRTAMDITMSMTRKHNTSTDCESNNVGLKNCNETSSEILFNGTKSSMFPEFTRCINTDRCLICLQKQWFVNSCSKLYSLPKIKCSELTKRILLKPGSSTTNIVWNEPTVDADTRLTTYNNGMESGKNLTSGFYSVLYSATNNQGLTTLCTTEFRVSDISCVLPPIPEGGTRTCNGSSLGSSCHYRCYMGFYMDQQYDVITCGLNGEYHRKSPKCPSISPPKITCLPPNNHIIPVDPVNLTAVATWDFPVAVDQSGATIQSINIHQVSSNYSSGDVIPRGLHYFQYHVIDVNGASDSCSFTIDMRFLQCRALKPPVNGNITCNFTDFRHNTQCVYNCRPAYILHGFPILTCLDTESYDYPEPSCHVLKCPEPSQLSSNSYVSCSNNNNINSTCVVLCKPGFNPTSSNNTSSCLSSGNWNISFPSCKDSERPVFISCPKTNIFHHYDSLFESSVPVIWSVIIATDNSGEEITPEVIEGKDSGELFYPGVTKIQYRAVDSKGNEAICQFYVIISVLASGCSAGTIFNANPDNCAKCAVGFYQDAENALECKPCPGGFTTKSIGASTFQDCKKNETLLSRNRRASTSCSEPELNDPSMLFKCTGYDMNDVCRLSCLSGRQPIGSNRIVCVFDLNTGRFVWLPKAKEQPRCRPLDINCVLPPIPDGGTRTCNGSSLGSSCHYRCYMEFYMDQQYDVITCGLNGEYDRKSPKCPSISPPKITCFPPNNHIIPVDPVNLTAVATWDFPVAVDQSGATIQSINIHQVRSNYSSGDVIPRGLHYFQYDVIDVNGASDSCSFTIDMRFLKCRALKPPVNGNITCNSTDFRHNTQCVYSCRPAYILHNFPVLTCLDTESYDYPEPSCHVLRCPEPSQLSSNSYVNCSNKNNINSTCVVLCKPGFNLTSSNNTSSCLSSGNWNISFPSCKDSERPVFISCPKTNIFHHYDSLFESSVPVIWSVIIATDNSGEEITPEVIEGKDSGELFYPGVTKIQYRAVDSKGNEAICQFHVIISVLASGCSAGTIFNANPDNCAKCAVGFYQDAENALECKPCPGGFTTKSLGASTFQDCKKNETLLSRDKRASTSCSEPELNDPSMLFKCTGYDMNDVCRLSCLSGRQPIGSNRIVCVFDLNTGRFVWLSEAYEQPRCRPQGDLVGILCTFCKQFLPGANCCPVPELKHTDWMPMDFSEIKPQPPCEDFVPPAKGQSYASIISGVKSFTLISCPADKSLPRNSGTATCDLKTGVWNPAPWLQECTEKYYPVKYRLEMIVSYSGKSCSSPGVREQLKLRFTSLLHSSRGWLYHCPSSRQCSAEDVMVFCSYRRKRRDIRKRAIYKTVIKWQFSVRLFKDEMKGEKVKQLKDILFKMFFGFAEDTYSGRFNQINGFYFDFASLNMGGFTYVCDTGAVYDIATKTCLVCSSGTMYDVKTDRCVECSHGYYQDRDNSRMCFQCQPRTTTQYKGSTYHTQCQIQCSAGYFSTNGFLPCLPCPSRGTSSRGSTKCQHKRPRPKIQDFCSNSSCVANNNTCQNTVDGYRCFCKAGYSGKECNITINPCTYIQCENGAICEASTGGEAICRCLDGYTGDFCQAKIVKDVDRTSTWTEWTSWGDDCRTQSPDCGQGIQTRARNCTKDLKGTQCPGADRDSRECNKIGCPVCKEEYLKLPYSIMLNCSWSNSTVSDVPVLDCNVTCRVGYMSLYNVSHVTCKDGIWTSGLAKNICIIEPEWSDWSVWSSCPSVCDGERKRTRICSNPPFYSGPPLCKGDNLQSYPCSRDYPDRKCSNCSVTDLHIPPTMNDSCSLIKGILTCIMSCRSNQILYDKITLDHAYTCNQGIWSPSNNVLPCTDFHQPLALSKMISATYQTNCTDTSKASNITAEISRNLNSIINSTSHQVLVRTPQCTTDNLVVTTRIKINIDKSNTFIQASESVSAMTRRAFAINSSEDIILPVNVAEISQLHCPDNTVVQGAYCVECPVGSYYHLDECLLCPLGSYQPSARQCSCIRCPFRTTTRYLGSGSLLDCR